MSKTWPIARLGEVIRHRKEFITIDDTATYRRPRAQLHAQGIVLRDEIPGALIKTKQQQVCRGGEFLVAEIDAKVGGFGIVPDELDGAIVSSHYFLFGVDEAKLDGRYLNYFIQTPAFREQVEAQGSTNYAAIRPAQVLGYMLPLPPLTEQRRMVARIEKLAGMVLEARTLRYQAAKEAVALVASARSSLFRISSEDPTLADVCKDVTDGTHDTPQYVDDGFPFLTGKNISPDGLNFDGVRHISKEDHDRFSRHCSVERGDVLLTLIGTIDKVAIVDTDRPFSVKNVGLLKPDPKLLHSRYLFAFLQSSAFQEQAISYAKKTAQAFVGLKKLRTARIPTPPLPEQQQIVLELDSLQAKAGSLTRLQSETAAELNALIPAILDRAFKGELV